jgi:UMF1 family MFS transporter
MSALLNKRTLAWAFYDWANSAYATIVMTAFFPIIFGTYWYTQENTTTPLGLADAAASLVIALLAPVLGAVADRGGLKKRFLLVFLCVGVTSIMALSFVGKGEWLLALMIYVLSFVGFAGANVFYDAMLVEVSSQEKLDMTSALGYSLGYIGGGVALLVCVVYASPEKFGMTHTTPLAEMTGVFLFVGLWWAIFSLPLLLSVKETRGSVAMPMGVAIKQGLLQLAHTFREIRKLKVIFTFLLAYWFYIDGVDTIILMAGDYGRNIGFDSGDLIMAFLLTQFVAFPAAIVYGKIGEKLGVKSALLIAIVIYIGITIYGSMMTQPRDFYILAIIVGLVMGGIQSLSRSLYARLIPANKAAEFFGFYNMLGKLAAVLGPALMGITRHFTGSPRLAILSVMVFFVIGGILLSRVNVDEGINMAHSLEKIN